MDSATPRVELVVAMGANGVIGQQGAMPWRLSTDMKRFRAITMGCPVVMGRKTFASIGKALAGRANIVMTRDPAFQAPDVTLAGDFDQALDLARRQAAADGVESIFVIGGGQVYAQALPHADRLHVTHVGANPAGDTFFPRIDPAEWEEETAQNYPAGAKDSAATRYVIYRRR